MNFPKVTKVSMEIIEYLLEEADEWFTEARDLGNMQHANGYDDIKEEYLVWMNLQESEKIDMIAQSLLNCAEEERQDCDSDYISCDYESALDGSWKSWKDSSPRSSVFTDILENQLLITISDYDMILAKMKKQKINQSG